MSGTAESLKIEPEPSLTPPAAIDARALATRAMSRDLDGDRPGAIADLRAALEVEQDPGRRTAITGLLHYLGSGR